MKALMTMILMSALVSCASHKMNYGVVKKTTDKSFKTVKAKALGILKKKKLKVMAIVDHQKNAKRVGKKLPETTVIIFGNPNLGTPLMQNSRSVAVDLPQKLLIYREMDHTVIQYNDPYYLQQRHGLSKDLPQLKKISGALNAITESLL